MKHTLPDAFLSRSILCFVRDDQPTVAEFVARHGGSAGQGYHLLRKHGILIVDAGRLKLNRRHLSPDGQRFVWGSRVIHLDDDTVEMVRWGPQGPPSFE